MFVRIEIEINHTVLNRIITSTIMKMNKERKKEKKNKRESR